MTQLQSNEADAPKILQRIIRRVDYYSPEANACSTSWAPHFRDFELASDFLWRHFYEHFGRKKA